MSDMTDERAAEVLAAMRQDGGTVDDADWIAAIDHAVSRLHSQPPAECSSFSAADMTDAAAQGFRDGVASVGTAAVGRGPGFVRCGDGTYRAFKGDSDD